MNFLNAQVNKHITNLILGSLLQKNDRIEVNGEVKSQLLNAKLDSVFLQTDTSFDVKGDLTYETADGDEHLGVEGGYKLESIGSLDKHLFSVQLQVRSHHYSF